MASISRNAVGAPALAAVSARPTAAARLDHVDLLRGTIMVLMLLDHTRDFFMNTSANPTNLTTATPALFLTRWVTHFCAPTFMLLAGVGAFLRLSHGRTRRELSWFLLTRGLWLVVLEFTLSRWGIAFGIDYHAIWVLVLWALGWSMVALAGLIYLPDWALATFSFVMIAGHNLLDSIRPAAFGKWAGLWSLLHQPGLIPLTKDRFVLLGYPLVPWIAVMAAGYLLGNILLRPQEERRKTLLRMGLAVTVLFVVLRAINLYGDPLPWKPQSTLALTVCSFLNCQKYPPSLLFLAMTLGPALVFLSLADRPLPKWTRPLVTFGRVPMFFYLLQFPMAHLLALLLSAALGLDLRHLLDPNFVVTRSPDGYGFPLGVTYAMWLLGTLLLYPACSWYAAVKQRSRSAWLSYL